MENQDNKSKLKHFVAGAALVLVLGTAIPAGENYFAQVTGSNTLAGEQVGPQDMKATNGNFQESSFKGGSNFQEGGFKGGNNFQEGGFKGGFSDFSKGSKFTNEDETLGGFKGGFSDFSKGSKFTNEGETSGGFKGGFGDFFKGEMKKGNENFDNFKSTPAKFESQESIWPSSDKKLSPKAKKIEVEELDVEAVDIDYTNELEKLVKNAEKTVKLKSFKTLLEKIYTYASKAEEIYQEAELEGCEEKSETLTEWLSLNASGQKLTTKEKSALKKDFKAYISCVKQSYKDATTESEE